MNKRFKQGVSVAAISVTAHLLAIGVLFPKHYSGSPGSRNAQAVQVRLETGADTSSASLPDPMSVEADAISSLGPMKDPSLLPAGSLAEQKDAGEILTGSSDKQTEGSNLLPAGDLSPEARQQDYLPASALDVRPSATAPVVVPFPDALLGKRKATAILVLFIDAEGKVEHVDIEKSDLPPLFEKTAMDTFMHARMNPGMKGGIPVKTRMKVEVEFEGK